MKIGQDFLDILCSPQLLSDTLNLQLQNPIIRFIHIEGARHVTFILYQLIYARYKIYTGCLRNYRKSIL